MASYEIPEEIIGVPLFVPDGNDYFSIESGGMPNGDDCLNVLGATSADYKAFQPVPVTSPNIVSGGPLSMTFWFWTASSHMGAAHRMLLCIENSSSTDSPRTGSANCPLGIGSTQAASNPSFFVRRATNQSGNPVDSFVVANTWRMVTVNFPASTGTVELFFDNDISAAATSNATALSPGSNLFLCIGGYAGTNRGLSINHRIGKIAFHDHQLSQTERSLLWEAMMS